MMTIYQVTEAWLIVLVLPYISIYLINCIIIRIAFQSNITDPEDDGELYEPLDEIVMWVK
jgi:uncharacterized protein (DUF1499 family)